MGYVKADEILPEELITLIQQYVDGTNIYIPRKTGNRIGWGENNQTKEKLLIRDKSIYDKHVDGLSVHELAKQYYLSEKSIQRILRNMKNV